MFRLKEQVRSRAIGRVLCLLLSFAALLSFATFRNWAEKKSPEPNLQSGDARDIDPQALAYFRRVTMRGHERPLGLSPLGESFRPNLPPPGKRRGLVYTPAGFIDPKSPSRLEFLPPGLRGRQGANGGGSREVLLIQLREEALRQRGAEAIEDSIHSMGGVVSASVPQRGMVIAGPPGALDKIRASDFVEASLAYAPGFKIDPLL